MIVRALPPNLRGFDANVVLTDADAAAAVAAGFAFAVRYVRRGSAAASDVSRAEIDRLLGAGLAIGLVQHVENEISWMPSAAKGADYGSHAAAAYAELGIPPGVMLALDLEGVDLKASAQDTIAYCDAWYTAVAASGALPVLYIGWDPDLSPEQLWELPFTRYWASYNLNSDQLPARRGICLKQHDPDVKLPFRFDLDVSSADTFGDAMPFLMPAEAP